MRVVEFEGYAVRRQRQVKDAHGNIAISVTFYDPEKPAIVVSPATWKSGMTNKYYDDPNIRRRDVVRRNDNLFVCH
jgi:hypothetical protein